MPSACANGLKAQADPVNLSGGNAATVGLALCPKGQRLFWLPVVLDNQLSQAIWD